MKTTTIFIFCLCAVLGAQERDVVLKNWAVPVYWQPSPGESELAAGRLQAELRASSPEAATPAGSLVFVAMTPCRVVDTRASQGFPMSFGVPSLSPVLARSFPIQSSTRCPIPAAAQAYSFNVTVIPPGPLGFLTIWPHGQPQPNAVTLDDLQGQIVNNAAIVSAGNVNGSVDIAVNANTDVVLDINGYYVASTGVTLAQGTAGAPSLSFSGDAGTGIFSSGTGNLNFATGGASHLTVRPDGDLDLTGNIRQNGALFLSDFGDGNLAVGLGALSGTNGSNNNTATGFLALHRNTGNANTAMGSNALLNNTTGSSNIAIGLNAGANLLTGSNNIDIANNGDPADNGVIRIGGGNQTGFFAGGVRGVTTGAHNAVTVMIDSNGQLGTVNSSRRFKEDIQNMGDASSGLLRLRPVTYRYQRPYVDGSKPIDYGLIAEEVAEMYPDLVVKDAGGKVEPCNITN